MVGHLRLSIEINVSVLGRLSLLQAFPDIFCDHFEACRSGLQCAGKAGRRRRRGAKHSCVSPGASACWLVSPIWIVNLHNDFVKALWK